MATAAALVERAYLRTLGLFGALGQHMVFYSTSASAVPQVIRKYRSEIAKIIAEVALGRAALAVVGGSLVIITVNTLVTGMEVGILGYSTLQPLGLSVLIGFAGGYFSTREIAPIVTAFAYTSVVGAGFTAQIGAMRVNEEIDALEVMSVRPIPFLASTRIIAGLVSIVPLYAVALTLHYVGLKFVTAVGFDQSSGAFDHYFATFLLPQDVFISFAKVISMCLVITLIQCYYGFHASGGPAGVGTAVGRGVRNSLVAALIVDMLVGLAFFGPPNTIRIAS